MRAQVTQMRVGPGQQERAAITEMQMAAPETQLVCFSSFVFVFTVTIIGLEK